MPAPPVQCRRPPGAPPSRCPGTRCSGRGCPTAPRGSRGRSGSGCPRKKAVTDTTKPGVQIAALQAVAVAKRRLHACESSPSGAPMPSIVVTSVPSAWTANMRHERTAAPSTRTVQAPHTPCSQPRCVPVRWHRSRRKSASVRRASTADFQGRPLTRHVDRRFTHGAPPRSPAFHARSTMAAPSRRR